MTLRREVEARGAFSLDEAFRTERITRLERTVAQGWRLINAHSKRIHRLRGIGDNRRANEAIEAQWRRLGEQRSKLGELHRLRLQRLAAS